MGIQARPPPPNTTPVNSGGLQEDPVASLLPDSKLVIGNIKT
jgi:hypothetical protein